MITKQMIIEELDVLEEDDLDKLYRIIKDLEAQKYATPTPSLMTRLKRVKIDAPPDFAANLHLYLSGEKHVE
ncbi:MAG: hypothetical protein GXP42_16935 [Chloroflexi bacterium]|nr:hypothetical protein [Chloroflexota bacterium]